MITSCDKVRRLWNRDNCVMMVSDSLERSHGTAFVFLWLGVLIRCSSGGGRETVWEMSKK